VKQPLVSVTIVTWNSEKDILKCLASVQNQSYPRLEITVVDNASHDNTVRLVEEHFPHVPIIRNHVNRGFSAGQNQAINASRGDCILLLNPDVVIADDYVSAMVKAAKNHPSIGMITGKLWRYTTKEGPIIDTTGIIITRNNRHLDRGFNTVDRGQYDDPCLVFGVSGCCAFLKREMLEDISFEGEYLDEDFFAYREDVDLAWRAQWRGWRALYMPQAHGFHTRKVHPANRNELPPLINYHSSKNRFLLRIKNQPLSLMLRFIVPTTWRDLQLLAYIIMREWSSIPALFQVIKLLPRYMKKRRFVLQRRTVTDTSMKRWFYNEALPLSALESAEDQGARHGA
jgi:GT2 family glycosyltransferase